jgi:hypothetical protein
MRKVKVIILKHVKVEKTLIGSTAFDISVTF